MRLDLLDPLVSGNKPFKLSEYISSAKNSGHEGIVTFGGAWSNHIHATAYATRAAGLKSIGIIRGERPPLLSSTLLDAEQAGMELRFVSRSRFREWRSLSYQNIQRDFPGYTVVPEGGAGQAGKRGASQIMDLIPKDAFDWIVCACGTGTTLAGLISGANPGQRFVGISVLRGHSGLKKDINDMLNCTLLDTDFEIIDRFHFGGYAQYDDALINFMNDFHDRSGIPTDIVYTGKLMRAIDTLFMEGFFPSQARVLAIHSGGLQGNRSLAQGCLQFS